MGSVGRALFGGSKQKSESKNLAYNDIKGAYGPAMNYTGQGGDAVSALLGLGGDSEAQSKALDNYTNSAGYDFLYNKGSDKIMSNQAMGGLLRSGSTLKGLETFKTGLNSTFLSQYMDNLFKLSNLGLGAGGLVSSAGSTSTGSGNSKNGIVPGLSSLIAAI